MYHLVEKQLKKREMEEIKKFANDGQLSMGYDTPEPDHASTYKMKTRVAKSVSPDKTGEERARHVAVSNTMIFERNQRFQMHSVQRRRISSLAIKGKKERPPLTLDPEPISEINSHLQISKKTESGNGRSRQRQTDNFSNKRERVKEEAIQIESKQNNISKLCFPVDSADNNDSDFSESINNRDVSYFVAKKRLQTTDKKKIKKKVSRSPILTKNSSMISKNSIIKSQGLKKLQVGNENAILTKDKSTTTPSLKSKAFISQYKPKSVESSSLKDSESSKMQVKVKKKSSQVLASKDMTLKAEPSQFISMRKINMNTKDNIKGKNTLSRKHATYRQENDRINENVAYEEIVKQNESLINNGLNIKLFHPEHGQAPYIDIDCNSFGTISSAEENECMLMFKGDYTFRFQATKQINQKSQDKLRYQMIKEEAFRKQTSKTTRFLNFICCRKIKMNRVIPGSQNFRRLISRSTKAHHNLGLSINEQKSSNNEFQELTNINFNDQKLQKRQGSFIVAAGPKVVMHEIGNTQQIKTLEQNSNRSNYSKELENKEEGYGSEDDGFSQEEEELMQYALKPNIFQRTLKKLDRLMINQNEKKVKVFHIILAITMYTDFFLTGFLIGNIKFQENDPMYKNWINHETIYLFVCAIQFIGIILNFFIKVVVDTKKWNTFSKKSLQYLKFMFWVDVAAFFPYHLFSVNYLFLRYLKIFRFKEYQKFLVDSLSEVLQEMMSSDNLRKQLDTVSMLLFLLLVSHQFACIWILIGMDGYYNHEPKQGWIAEQYGKGMVTLDFSGLYCASFYFIILSFSSIGYGDIVARTETEFAYNIIVQIIGIGVYSYMIGTIQSSFMDLGQDDQMTELQESINLWLVKIDRSKPTVILSKKVFDDVRDFYIKKFKHEIKLVVDDPEHFYDRLKPRLKKMILDMMFQSKYEQFKYLFSNCGIDFQREIIYHSTFRYYTAKQHQDESDQYFKDPLDQPVIIEAFQETNDFYMILSGSIYIMDSTGMYGYGILRSGSYFGDISILLNKVNQYSYFYNPFQEKPLQLLKIGKKDLLYICAKFPIEYEVWKERAIEREMMFENFKTLNLLKYMKAIQHKPTLIKEIDQMRDSKLKILNKVNLLGEAKLKLGLIKLFVFQYDLKRQIKKMEKIEQKFLDFQKKSKSKKGIEEAKPENQFIMHPDEKTPTTQNRIEATGQRISKDINEDTLLEFPTSKKKESKIGKIQSVYQDDIKQSKPIFSPGLDERMEEQDDEQIDSSRAFLPKTIHESSKVKILKSQPQSQSFQRLKSSTTVIGGPNQDLLGKIKVVKVQGNHTPIVDIHNLLDDSQNDWNSAKIKAEFPMLAGTPVSTKEKEKECSTSQKEVEEDQVGITNERVETKILHDVLRRCNNDIKYVQLKTKNIEQLKTLEKQNNHDISQVVNEYLYQKRRKIKKTENMKNSLAKLTTLYKAKFQNVLKSKDIAHLDLIIEEYLSLDEINNQILFDDNDKKDRAEQFPINHQTVSILAFNQRLLNQNVKAAIDKEKKCNDDFHLLKIHGIHLCKSELNTLEQKLTNKFSQIELKLQKRRQMNKILRKTITILPERSPAMRFKNMTNKTNELQKKHKKFFNMLSQDMKIKMLQQLESKILLYEQEKNKNQANQNNNHQEPTFDWKHKND